MPEIQGGQWGDHNVQINLFTGKAPKGPVVAGNVPQAPPAFQPREDLMAQLRNAGPGVSVVRAITGMRGVGKTQLAAAYARECINKGWRLVAWINAEDTPGMLNDLAVVADRLGISKPGTDLEIIGGEVRNRLEADGEKCLIVFDNVTDPDAIRPYLPSAGESQVVVTSTQGSVLTLGRPTHVDVFTEQQSLDFLADRTSHRDSAGAKTLADQLGHLPVALAQAAAVIRAQHLTYPVYLGRLRSYPTQRYLPPVKGDPYPHGVAEAILLSIDAVTASDPTGLCEYLLEMVSLLSPEGISRQFLYSPEPTGGAEVIDEAVGRLVEASLLTFSGGSESGEPIVAAHRLVMRVARERSAHHGTLISVGAMTGLMLSDATESIGEPWQNRTTARDIVRHVIALNDSLAPYVRAGQEPMAEGLLAARGWALGCLNSLGDAAAQAVELGESLLADGVRVLGEEHPSTLIARSELGGAYLAVGRVGEAISLDEQTFAHRVRVSGEDHPATLMSRHNLAYAYLEAGRLDEAIPLIERTLADQVRVLGESHPDTLSTRSSLAVAYQKTGRRGEVIALMERTLVDYARTKGEDHPDTLRSLNNLAVAYQDAGRVDEAIALFERALADCVRMLSEGHPGTLNTQNNLAEAYRMAGRTGEAISLYERTLADRARVLGEEHPDTLVSRQNLALAYQEAGRLDEAIPLLERALAGLERVLGQEHPTTVTVRNNLTDARQQGDDTARLG